LEGLNVAKTRGAEESAVKVILEEWGTVTPYTPGHLEGCQKKEVGEGAACKCMKRKIGNPWRVKAVLSSLRQCSGQAKMGIVGIHPGCFCPAEPSGMQNSHMSGKYRTYRREIYMSGKEKI
jgi:hypothetical protein